MAFLPIARRRALSLLAAVAAVAAITVSPAQAAAFTVTNTNDSGAGSLRQAVLDANANPGADTITFSVIGTITLTTGQLTVTDDLTIDGSDPASLTISAYFSRVLQVDTGVGLTLEDVTIADGHVSGSPQVAGAGILNFGTLIVTRATFSRNVASGGGVSGAGIGNSGGTVTVADSTFSGNGAGGAGAGIYTENGTLTVLDSSFSANSASDGGGAIGNFSGVGTLTRVLFSGNTSDCSGAAIRNESATLTVIASTFSANTATFCGGGGIGSARGAITVSDSTFSGNTTGGGGGGITNYVGPLVVTNSTFVQNTAGSGGAILNLEAEAVITNSTLSGNSGGGGSDAFWTAPWTAPSSFVLENTIVANHASGGSCSGPLTDGGGNLSWPDTTCPGLNQDPMLEALGDNGGSTDTMALPSGSPALDVAVTANCPTTDQRGVTRPQGAGCDIGAFELVQTVTVGIDIKPGGFPNSINTAKKGVIPVAILSTSTFDAADVDPSTVCFGDAEEASQRDCTVAPGTKLKDVNADTILDLVLHFNTEQTGIDPGDTQACLTGELFDTTQIEGCDSIKAK